MKPSEIVVAFNTAFSNFPDLTAKYGVLGKKKFDGNPEPTDTYMMCHLLNPDFQSLAVDGSDDCDVLRGIFQVDIYTPIDSGIYQASLLAESLKSYFPRNVQIVNGETHINIERVVFNSNGVSEGAHKMYPVSIYYNVLS